MAPCLLLALACACGGNDGSRECVKDTDCKGQRVCEAGECIEPGTSAAQQHPVAVAGASVGERASAGAGGGPDTDASVDPAGGAGGSSAPLACPGPDPVNDAVNCGECGQVCWGALIAGQNRPSGIALDATHVYWTTFGSGKVADGAVMKMPLAGGEPVVLASAQTGPTALALTSTSVFWINTGASSAEGAILTVPLAGGSAVTIAARQQSPVEITADESSVYWTNFGDSLAMAPDGAVMKAPVAGGPAQTLAVGQPSPVGIAVDQTSVYWTNMGEIQLASGRSKATGTVMRVPLGGGTPVTLVSGLAGPRAIAVDATSAYWLNAGDIVIANGTLSNEPGTVMKAPLGGGTPVTLATGQDGPIRIAVDDANVYWTSSGMSLTDIAALTTGSVVKIPLQGGTLVTIASGVVAPREIAVRSGVAYWTSDDGSIMGPGGTCNGGSCQCGEHESMCGGVCVDLQTSLGHCGGCGRACAPRATCQAGACSCPGAEMLCGEACVDVESDAHNCGSCGVTCPENGSCEKGVCKAWDPEAEGCYHCIEGSSLWCCPTM